ncbi:MAG: DUF2971 domain-containing protein [Bacteroidaceae bacterium]|nr:DUF2971 domain-containing protein [Prevotella sp.]MBR4534872.1 DUF2971 domain-containing protein [Bacteroidaceae bacterium]
MKTQKMKNKSFIDSYLKAKPTSLWHYTSYEVLNKIMKDASSGRDYMCFWFSNPLQTNDSREVHFFQDHFLKKKRRKAIYSVFEKYHNIIGHPFTLSLIHQREGYKTYPFCDIPMWGMYGDNFKGVRLKFNFDLLKQYCQDEKEIKLIQCQYLTESDMDDKARQISNAKNDSENDMEKIYKQAICFKKCYWAYENEWRLVVWKNSIENIYSKPDGRLYTQIELPLCLLEAIEIGSKADQDAIEGSLHLLKKKLISKGISVQFEIRRSKLQFGYV